MAQIPAPTAEDYKLAHDIQQRRGADPSAQPSSRELTAIDRILVQQARERLEQGRQEAADES